ncbi:hypothetical protein B0A55_09665 [Friedmanniomyces simplex]|uniref:Uncharacterized protein n=1 Tax=Friedmanniomyces simplex TaxID=329884 RepID=A0A4U0WU06_9PEZI|nr:hypothetical protein B0A55_09665 [Friedmanniomyces simplex]
MQFPLIAPLLAATCSSVLAKPLPLDFHDIERRWSQGQSEAEIHPANDIREATPAWTVVRSPDAAAAVAFESTTDERTMLERTRYQKRDTDSALMAKMRKFVEDFYRRKGLPSMIAWRAAERKMEEAPVLKPRKGMRYRYTR